MKKTRWIWHKYQINLTVLLLTYALMLLQRIVNQRHTDISMCWDSTFHEMAFAGSWLPLFLLSHVLMQKHLLEPEWIVRVGDISKAVRRSFWQSVRLAVWYAFCLESGFVVIMGIGNTEVWKQTYMQYLPEHFFLQAVGWTAFGVLETCCLLGTRRVLFSFCILELILTGINLSNYLGMGWEPEKWVRPLDLMFRLPEIQNQMAGCSTFFMECFAVFAAIWLSDSFLKRR